MQDKLLSNVPKLSSYLSQRNRQQEINVAVSIEHKQILARLQQIRSLNPSCIYTQRAYDNISLALAEALPLGIAQHEPRLRSKQRRKLEESEFTLAKALPLGIATIPQKSAVHCRSTAVPAADCPPQSKKPCLKLQNLLDLSGSWRSRSEACGLSQNILSKLYNLSIPATVAGEFLISSNISVKSGFTILTVTSGVFWLSSQREKQKKKFVSLFFLFFLLDVFGLYCWVLKPLIN